MGKSVNEVFTTSLCLSEYSNVNTNRNLKKIKNFPVPGIEPGPSGLPTIIFYLLESSLLHVIVVIKIVLFVVIILSQECHDGDDNVDDVGDSTTKSWFWETNV
uniref:Uncharacterized protein n=1 Tax=Glossina brevipalpis TaxID=37001 RepID=A0A1A9X135_9MUSC